jgi:type VI secretion system protein ImpF
MALSQSTPYERLQPCLFDRLIDDEVQKKEEGRLGRVISLSEYQKAVLRDLKWLLNSTCHIATEGLDDFPDVRSSVFNFGIPTLSGVAFAGLELDDLEAAVTRAIRDFEPRIVSDTLSVRVVRGEASDSPTTLFFEIRGELWARPFPEKLFIKTSLDMETGAVTM